jgi:hypothetical protein
VISVALDVPEDPHDLPRSFGIVVRAKKPETAVSILVDETMQVFTQIGRAREH